MTHFRLLLVAFALAMTMHVTTALTFAPEFEKGLGEKIAVLEKDMQAYPKLRTKVEGYPMSVAEWSAFNRSEIKTKLKSMLAISFVDMIGEEPSHAVEISDFHIHLGQMITYFQNSIESSVFTVAPPKTTQPPQTSRPWRSSTGLGSGSSDTTESVTSRPSFSFPSTTTTPAPVVTLEPIKVKVGYFETWQIVLFIVVGLILLFRGIHWYFKRQAKQKKLREEAAAAAAELGQSDFAVVNPSAVEEKQIKIAH